MRNGIKLVSPFILIIAALMWSIVQMDRTLRKEHVEKYFARAAHDIAMSMQKDQDIIINDLIFLANLRSTRQFLTNPDAESRQLAEIEFMAFSNSRNEYSQLRLLNTEGLEMLRINRRNGLSNPVAAEQLQDKSSRYYFKESRSLLAGQLYQSSLDLNIEQGKIVEPHEPTIRFATPVSNLEGKKVGYLVLNFNASSFLNSIQTRASTTEASFFLLNKDGYYLSSSSRDKLWGFMQGQEQITFANDFPEAWKQLQEAPFIKSFSIGDRAFLVNYFCSSRDPCEDADSSYFLPSSATDLPWMLVGVLSRDDLYGQQWWQGYWPYLIMSLLSMVAFMAIFVTNRLITSLDTIRSKEQELNKSVIRFETLLHSVPSGLLIINRHGIIEGLNQQGEKILEESSEHLIGSSLLTVIGTDTERRKQSEIIDAFFTKPSSWVRNSKENPYVYTTPTGNKKYLIVEMTYVELHEGTVAIVRFDDITKELREDEIKKQSQKLETMGQLVGGVAHDFNNILGVIMGNLELLQLQIKYNHSANNHVDRIMKSVKSAADLTQKLLRVSRKNTLSLQRVEVDSIMEDIVSLIRRTIKNRIQIDYLHQPNLPDIETDPSELISALLNLAVNARDAMPEGGRIIIKTKRATLDTEYIDSLSEPVTPGDYLLIEFSDSGSGIPKEIQEKIYEPFFTTKRRGTGLGLAMVYGFIKQSKGHMRIYSEEGQGTTVNLYLPFYQKKRPAEKEAQEDDESENLEGKKVLIVDDEEDLAAVARDFLQLEKAECTVVYSAQQAIDELSRQNFDLVLSDVVMPGEMDGLQLYKYIIDNGLPVEVVLCSGFSEEMVKVNCDADSNLIFLRKPYNRREVVSAAREALTRKRNKQCIRPY